MAKKITIETLAVMIQNGFKETASKKEVDELRGDFAVYQKSTDGRFKIIVDQLDLMSADIRDIKITLGPLVRMVAALDTDVQDLQIRMKRLEQKVALAK